MKRQTGSRRIRHGILLVLLAGLLAGTAQGAWPDFLATGGDRSFCTNFPDTATQTVYGVHQFTNTVGISNFTPNIDLTVEYLVIAGGGGGGTGDQAATAARAS